MRTGADSVLSWGEIGPGNNLGLFAAKGVGPTAARAQLYSIAAASGKVGAFIGTYTFGYIVDRFHGQLHETGIFYIGSGIALLSALVTLLFLPNIKADNMVDEDRLFREYLVEHGVDITMMGTKNDNASILSAEQGKFERKSSVVVKEAEAK